MDYYAAFTKESYYTEGDERSRTNPGHGYPGGMTEYTGVKKFKDKEEMEEWVKYMDRIENHHYELVMCTPMKVLKTVKIEVI